MTVKLRGVMPPMVTPFTEHEKLNEDAFRAEVRYLIDAGVHGLCLSGGVGEGNCITLEEACKMVRIAVDEANAGVPIVCGIVQPSTRTVVRYAKALKDEGVEAVQITPPHYQQQPSDDGIVRYYDEIGKEVALPIVIYNAVKWKLINLQTLKRLIELEWVTSIKQSWDFDLLADLCWYVHDKGCDVTVLTALDTLLFPSYVIGADGCVAGAATVLPRLSVALWDAVQSGDLARARELHDRIYPVRKLLGTTGADGISHIKAAIEVQGRHVGNALRPQSPITDDMRDTIAKAVEACGELAPAPTAAAS